MIFVGALPTALWAEPTQSIEEFNALKSKWSTLVGTTLQIEGRYSIFSPSQLRMEKCSLNFILAEGIISPAGDSRTIQLKGRIEKRESKLVFMVSELLPLQSDVERFRSLKRTVASNKPEEWYKLADWGAHRADYYHDEALKQESQTAFRQGVLVEHRQLYPASSPALRKLAAKLASQQIDLPLQQELLHEALRIEYGILLKEGRGDEGGLLTSVMKELPGADAPLTPEDDPLRAGYIESPLVKFKEGDEAARRKYARMFYVDILKHRILKSASPDGKNGFDIADRIEQQLPEYRSLAPEYRQRQYDYYLMKSGSMTRKEMGELIVKLEPLDNPEFVTRLKQRWLIEKEKRIDQTNVVQLVDLGDDYLIIMDDRGTAIKFYKMAYAISPGTQVISDWLKEQGLTLQSGVWLAKGESLPETNDPLLAAVRAGIVREGMNGEQVKSSLGGEPSRKTRIATGTHIQEWWVYEDQGVSVEFTRRRRPGQSLVTKVIQSRQQRSITKPSEEKPVGSEGF